MDSGRHAGGFQFHLLTALTVCVCECVLLQKKKWSTLPPLRYETSLFVFCRLPGLAGEGNHVALVGSVTLAEFHVHVKKRFLLLLRQLFFFFFSLLEHETSYFAEILYVNFATCAGALLRASRPPKHLGSQPTSFDVWL